MAENNLGVQKQKAIEMKGKVQEFAAVLTNKMDDLEDDLVQSVRAGFPRDIAETYHGGYYSPDRSIIDGLSKDMLTRHVDYLNRLIADLTDAINQK